MEAPVMDFDFDSATKLADTQYKSNKKRMLKVLLKEEKELVGTREAMILQLANSHKEMGEKLEQARELEKKIAKLKGGKNEQEPEEIANGADVPNCAKDAVLIFPEEVWGMIFENLSDWKDLRSCHKVCKLFRTILQPLRTTFLFYETFPYFYKNLTGTEVLDCRLACKAWNEGVDNLLENHRSLRPHIDDDSDPRYPPFVPPIQEKIVDYRHRFSSETRGGSYWMSMMEERDRTRNPIIGRQFFLNGSGGADINVLDDWLQTFGKEVHYLTFNYSAFYPGFHLRLFPNLRKLRLVGSNDRVFDFINIRIPSLETLQVEEMFRGRRRFDQSRFVRSHPQTDILLRSFHLQLGRLDVQMGDWIIVSDLEWPSLTELHVKGAWEPSHVNSFLHQGALKNLGKLGLNLEGISMEDILEVIDKLSHISRLNTVRLAGRLPDMFQEGNPEERLIYYASPKLTTLEVEHHRDLSTMSMTCYNFLLHFPFLQNLNVFWRDVENRYGIRLTRMTGDIQLRSHSQFDWFDAGDGDIRRYVMSRRKRIQWEELTASEIVRVNKYVYDGKMNMSNIWELLPRLKVFTFQEKLYTKQG